MQKQNIDNYTIKVMNYLNPRLKHSFQIELSKRHSLSKRWLANDVLAYMKRLMETDKEVKDINPVDPGDILIHGRTIYYSAGIRYRYQWIPTLFMGTVKL